MAEMHRGMAEGVKP